jgi:hypothetical protein
VRRPAAAAGRHGPTGAGEKERGGKGEQGGGRRPLWRLGGADGEERGQVEGSGVQRHVEGKIGKRDWAPGGHVRWGTGDPACARLIDGVGRHRGPVGIGWVREGVRGSEAVATLGH